MRRRQPYGVGQRVGARYGGRDSYGWARLSF